MARRVHGDLYSSRLSEEKIALYNYSLLFICECFSHPDICCIHGKRCAERIGIIIKGKRMPDT